MIVDLQRKQNPSQRLKMPRTHESPREPSASKSDKPGRSIKQTPQSERGKCRPTVENCREHTNHHARWRIEVRQNVGKSFRARQMFVERNLKNIVKNIVNKTFAAAFFASRNLKLLIFFNTVGEILPEIYSNKMILKIHLRQFLGKVFLLQMLSICSFAVCHIPDT